MLPHRLATSIASVEPRKHSAPKRRSHRCLSPAGDEARNHSHSRLREDTMSVASSADDATIYGLGGFLGVDENEFGKESHVICR